MKVMESPASRFFQTRARKAVMRAMPWKMRPPTLPKALSPAGTKRLNRAVQKTGSPTARQPRWGPEPGTIGLRSNKKVAASGRLRRLRDTARNSGMCTLPDAQRDGLGPDLQHRAQ